LDNGKGTRESGPYLEKGSPIFPQNPIGDKFLEGDISTALMVFSRGDIKRGPWKRPP